MHGPTNSIRVMVLLAFFGAACGSSIQADRPQATAAAERTAGPTSTARPTLTPTATPIPGPSSLADQATLLCDAAGSAPVIDEPMAGPVMGMFRVDYDQQPAWYYTQLVPYFSAASAADVRALFCVEQSRRRTGTYNDGEPAYRLTWSVRVLKFPGGELLTTRSLDGPPPPGALLGGGPGYGAPPAKELFAWVLQNLEDPSVFFVGEGISTLSFLPDGVHMAAGTERRLNVSYSGTYFDAQVFILDTSSGAIARTLSGHTDPITDLAASADGRFLASASLKNPEFDSTVRVWDLNAGRELHSLRIEDADIKSLAFAPDGNTLAVLTWDRIRLMETAGGTVTNTIELGGASIDFDSNGTLVLDNYEQTLFIDPADGDTLRSLPFTCVQDFAPGFEALVICDIDSTVTVINARDGRRIFNTLADPVAYATALSSNGLLALPNGNAVNVWDVNSGKLLLTLEGGAQPPQVLTFSPAGDLLASGTNDGFVKIWRVPAP